MKGYKNRRSNHDGGRIETRKRIWGPSHCQWPWKHRRQDTLLPHPFLVEAVKMRRTRCCSQMIETQQQTGCLRVAACQDASWPRASYSRQVFSCLTSRSAKKADCCSLLPHTGTLAACVQTTWCTLALALCMFDRLRRALAPHV